MDITLILISVYIATIAIWTTYITLTIRHNHRMSPVRTVLPSNLVRTATTGTYLTTYASDIYIGYCPFGQQPKADEAMAHAHPGKSRAICVFYTHLSRAEMEWTLAHEYAHLISMRRGCYTHADFWKDTLSLLGYPEEAEAIQGEQRTHMPECRANVNPLYARLADLVCGAIEDARPGVVRWIWESARAQVARRPVPAT